MAKQRVSKYVFDESLLLQWVELRLKWLEDAQNDERLSLGVSEEYRAGYAAAISGLAEAALTGKFHKEEQ